MSSFKAHFAPIPQDRCRKLKWLCFT